MPPHSLKVICAVLRHRLYGDELASAIPSALADGGIDDRRLVAVASSHRMTPAFAACLGDSGLDRHLPEALRHYFAFMRASNAARNRRLRDELGAVVVRLNSLGVQPCLLKGAGRLIDGIYPDESWRFMIDLDLLVPQERIADCVDALLGEGYEARFPDNPQAQHYPALIGAGKCAAVELHRRLVREPYVSLLPTHEVMERSTPVSCALGHVRLLEIEDQIVYAIAHSQLLHRFHSFGLVRLCDLVEIALLAKHCQLPWTRIAQRFARPDWRRACLAMLYVAEILLGTGTPEPSQRDLRARLQTVRVLGQQRFRSAMVLGIAWGWIAYGGHRLKHGPDQADFLARLAADPGSYLAKLTGALAEFAPRP